MLFAYQIDGRTLRQRAPEDDLADAQWIDLYRPQPAQVDRVTALGIDVPTLEDMEEIELSNRLYRAGETEVLTVTLPGLDVEKRRSTGPVAFILTPQRMVTVRYHTPRPFETFASHAAASTAGCSTHLHLFLGLVEEIIARLADLLEADGRALDAASHALFEGDGLRGRALEQRLRDIGQRGEAIGQFRLSLLTLGRALTSFSLGREKHRLQPLVKARNRDIQSLLVHADFLSSRVAQLTDVALGFVTLEQTSASRVLSVVAILFLPPTLVASVYGMNFAYVPGLAHPHGYLIATALMAGSALATYLFCKWKGWL
ncbi:magnesium transporter [Marivita lacus]|uniref:Magnesium transporter n=1 Tax=Marivita lacus TaxID=1323742 RepID=A0ABQ1KVY4_9RHOB|nr:CorA family divalent cation transporter [Marivita lacus]GGC07349.1 magnesium transporter [Marivita lacus]